MYRTIKTWNSIPETLRSDVTTTTFKNNYQAYLIKSEMNQPNYKLPKPKYIILSARVLKTSGQQISYAVLRIITAGALYSDFDLIPPLIYALYILPGHFFGIIEHDYERVSPQLNLSTYSCTKIVFLKKLQSRLLFFDN